MPRGKPDDIERQVRRLHLFAEHFNRYDVRCVHCGIRARDAQAQEVCPKAPDEREENR